MKKFTSTELYILIFLHNYFIMHDMDYQMIMKLYEILMTINLNVEEHIYKKFLFLFRGPLSRLSK
jgi:hypothetical protein